MLTNTIPDPQDQDASDRNAIQAYAQMPAARHIADTAPLPTVVPRRRTPRLPFAPWRFLAIATILLVMIPCGIEAAAPVWNGADLTVILLLASFVSVFFIPEDIR
ncbi:hypothetical protein [uncultured Microbacterium sp.]|uniref:hypothetical protein n=1 Tax=uncultured Microbacterium sp. TaxID=191216 RepID=UPI0025D41939|nr:hypothetical protein [uncultured Microbacterium sp.]